MICKVIAYTTGLLSTALLFTGSAAALPVRCAENPECAVRFADAQRLAKAGAHAEALKQFQGLQSEYGDAQTLYPIAVLLHRLQRPAEAVQMFERYLSSGSETKPDKLALVRRQLAQAQQEADGTELSGLLRQAPVKLGGPSLQLRAQPLPISDSAGSSRTPLYKRWWLWTSVGVVALGAAVAAGAATAAQASPPSWPDALDVRPFP